MDGHLKRNLISNKSLSFCILIFYMRILRFHCSCLNLTTCAYNPTSGFPLLHSLEEERYKATGQILQPQLTIMQFLFLQVRMIRANKHVAYRKILSLDASTPAQLECLGDVQVAKDFLISSPQKVEIRPPLRLKLFR